MTNLDHVDLESAVHTYLEAFEQRDVDRCAEYFADDATIAWLGGTYQGPADTRQWHADRFTANMRVLRVDAIRVRDHTVTVDAVAVSDRLKTMRLSSIGTKITATWRDGKIATMKFGLRFSKPL